MAIKHNEEIVCTHYTCMAEFGEACSHVAALLFIAEAKSHFKQQATFTPSILLLCAWLPPSFQCAPYVEVVKIDLKHWQ